MTDHPTYRRIHSIADSEWDIVILDDAGNVTRLGTAAAYEIFQLGCARAKATLYDEVERRWHVKREA